MLCGSTDYQKFMEWKQQMKERYLTGETIEDWNELRKKLDEEFNNVIKVVNNQRPFEEENRAYLRKIPQEINYENPASAERV